MKYIIKPATKEALAELLNAAKHTEHAFEAFGLEGYSDYDERQRMDSERQAALARLKRAIDKVEFIMRLDRAMLANDKEVTS